MRLITIFRCALVAMIVVLPATAGCRQPWKSQLMAWQEESPGLPRFLACDPLGKDWARAARRAQTSARSIS